MYLSVCVLELPDDEMNQGKLLMYNRAELKTSDHRSRLLRILFTYFLLYL